MDRRNFLRSLGACLALPAFESLAPFKLGAASAHRLATTATGAAHGIRFLSQWRDPVRLLAADAGRQF
jgi:hypothetical protein